MKIIGGFILIFSLALQSCKHDVYFDEFSEIPEGKWTYDNVLQFETQITDTLQVYDIYLNIKHSKNFDFRNLYVMVYTTFPSGKKLDQQLRLDLAEKSGKWRGKCSRNSCLAQFPIQLHAYFNEVGTYRFELEQNMRHDPMSEVLGAGITLYETELAKQ